MAMRNAFRGEPGISQSANAVAWVRANLLSTPFDVLLTVAALAFLYVTVVPLIDWAILSANWRGETLAACPDVDAACWAFIIERFDQILYGIYPHAERWRVDVGIALAIVVAAPLFVAGFRHKAWALAVLVLVVPVVDYVLFVGGAFGLALVETPKWGGLFLTLVVAGFGILTSFPLALLLALGRRSPLPVIRTLSATWIEFWRGVPMIAVLFVAITMFPLFVPGNIELDRLLRVLIAFTVVASAFIAEAVRGGLQSLPGAQYEAARALGLGYWRTMTFVILPQALRIAIPNIVNIFIGLFKETTLVFVIGLLDLLGIVQTAFLNPEWQSEQTAVSGYVFVALVFWVFCFGMSRYAMALERRLAQGRR